MKANKVVDRRWNFKFLNIFLEKAPIHGLPYLGRVRLTLLERIMWLILTLVALFLSIHLALKSLDRFRTKSTVISVERDYHYWNTTLASATICPMNRLDNNKFENYCARKGITGTNKLELFDFLESLANSTYFNFNQIKEYASVDKLNIDPMDYMNLIYSLTSDYLRTMEGNRVVSKVDTGSLKAQQVLTEWGICYTTNNFLIDALSTSNLLLGKPAKPNLFEPKNEMFKSFEANLFDDDAAFSFTGFTGPVSLFLHGAYEVMQLEKRRDASDIISEITIQLFDINASDQFQQSTSVEQRQCRFKDESNLTHFPIYTRNLCYQECRIKLAYKLCKCIPHFYPNRNAKKPVCHYQILKQCVFKYSEIFYKLYKIKNQTSLNAIQCNCLPNCRSSEITEQILQTIPLTSDLIRGSGVIIQISQYPRLRYQRQIIFTLTDLLVSVGGTAGFFLGSSVLSAVEIIYYFTIRLVWHWFGYKE